MYSIITENDLSQWNDKTGESYHFPTKYKNLLKPGTKVIYYKGKMTDKSFINYRLTPLPHYFGKATIGSVSSVPNKNEFTAEILEYEPFSEAILAKEGNEFLETIPANRISNYWRDGVRKLTQQDYQRILLKNFESSTTLNNEEFETEYVEGGKKKRYGTYYERDRKLRNAALKIHGYDCKVCDFNFIKSYGELGKDFIHVHHIKPISTAGRRAVNPKTDLIPVCPNCHSMIHRPKNNILTIEELKITFNKFR